jgi:hypothetical protein
VKAFRLHFDYAQWGPLNDRKAILQRPPQLSACADSKMHDKKEIPKSWLYNGWIKDKWE